ncbi:MAG: hypothetical protein F6J86_19595 [Symploca sp. SIO1B1]|nr:hypothetical protein [Symploca sp. SIO1C2]NER96016.1 hypothetical protein [Symploca sp. SIO1B1]
MNNPFLKNTLGSKETAQQVAQRAQEFVPAYQRFLEKHGLKAGEPFERLPQLDKESYILAYPFEELLATDEQEILAIYSSSGSSGNPFYWPTLKSNSRFIPAGVRSFLEERFAIHQKKTLAIVGLSLGSWAGGEYLSWAMKTMALDAPYPFGVFCPGNHHDEIIKMISQLNSLVDQIVLFMVPSAIAHLHLKATQLKQTLPLDKLKYVVLGEPFPENLRASLQSRAGIEENSPFMFSLYGSSDTGGLGVESLATIALRRVLCRNKVLADALSIESPIPHFFHFNIPNTFLETVDEHLCVTRWQGIPLVRYILYDRVALYSWQELKKVILTSELLEPEDEPWAKILSSASEQLPDLIAVTGRADSCLLLNGINLTEYMLDEAVKCQELQSILTGLYRAKIAYQEARQYLAFDLEIEQEVSPDQGTVDKVYQLLVQSLGKVQPIFLNYWRNVYSAWDNDPTQRILQLNLLPWPTLSQATETSIKYRGIEN